MEPNESLNNCLAEHVVVDGASQAEVPAEIRKRATVIATGHPISPAAARDLGLAIANGEWITSADDDDWLYPQSIDKRLHAIHAQPGARWSADYCTDDSTIDPGIAPAGPCSLGDIWRAWPTPKASIPLGPTTLLVEANLLKRAGGWMGLPQGEDIGMMMAATCMATGVVVDAYVYHVRLHVGQTTKTTWLDDLELLSRRCARERGEQILFEPPPEIRRFDPSFLSGDQPG